CKHLDRAESMEIDKRAVIASLRPDTQTIWLGLVEDEERRFLRHVFRSWEIIRSRIPPGSKAVLDAMSGSGQLSVLAGRIRDLAESEAAMEVHYVPRGRTRLKISVFRMRRDELPVRPGQIPRKRRKSGWFRRPKAQS